jgi:hypothetical protein
MYDVRIDITTRINDKSTVMFGDFNKPVLIIDRKSANI